MTKYPPFSGFMAVLAGIILIICPTSPASAQTRTLRIVSYNIAADINGATTALPGLIAPPANTNDFQSGGVLEGIGEEILNGNAQPLDILALQETTSNAATVVPIVNAMNTFYHAPGMFTNSTYQAVESNLFPGSGNGPNAIVYNTRTLQLLASTPVDPPGGTNNLGGINSSKSGMYREVMRYQFAPAGVAPAASNLFYIYISHYKSGASSTANNTNSRSAEAYIVRTNMMALPANSQIIYMGDFNTGDATEPMYATLTAPGTNQLIDPLNPFRDLTTNFDNSATPANLTDASTYLQYRDDYHMMTTNIYYGTGGGMAYVPGTFHALGNNGSVPYRTSVNSTNNTAISGLVTNGPFFITRGQLLIDLTNASDHLPVVADYTIPIPAPIITQAALVGFNLTLNVTAGITNATYTLLMSTNLSIAQTNWVPVATNVAGAGNFIFTATNAFSQSADQRFYLLQTR